MAVNPHGTKTFALIKNVAAAPVMFFDSAPVFGHNNGVVQITLTAQALGLRSESAVAVDLMAVANLRCTANAAANLIDALTKAIAMMNEPAEAEQPKH